MIELLTFVAVWCSVPVIYNGPATTRTKNEINECREKLIECVSPKANGVSQNTRIDAGKVLECAKKTKL